VLTSEHASASTSLLLLLDGRYDALARVIVLLNRKAAVIDAMVFRTGRAEVTVRLRGDRLDHLVRSLGNEVCVVSVEVLASSVSSDE
jgi:hypothetical protein